MMTTVLVDAGNFTVDAAEGLLLTPDDAERISGWTLKPEGMCRGTICVPLHGTMTKDGRVDLAALRGKKVMLTTWASW